MEFRKLIVGYVVEVQGIEYSDTYEGSAFAGQWGRSVLMGKIDFGSVICRPYYFLSQSFTWTHA